MELVVAAGRPAVVVAVAERAMDTGLDQPNGRYRPLDRRSCRMGHHIPVLHNISNLGRTKFY